MTIRTFFLFDYYQVDKKLYSPETYHPELTCIDCGVEYGGKNLGYMDDGSLSSIDSAFNAEFININTVIAETQNLELVDGSLNRIIVSDGIEYREVL